jgi:hypothetical protein
MLFVGHSESVWMQRLRCVARWARWFVLGLALGALVDVAVRVAIASRTDVSAHESRSQQAPADGQAWPRVGNQAKTGATSAKTWD